MKNLQSGQTLIIVLLAVTTSLLVGVGLMSRQLTNVQRTSFSEESNQALHFAEACVEDALAEIKAESITSEVVPFTSPCPLDVNDDGENDCEYSVNALVDVFPGRVAQDDVVELKTFGGGFDCDSVKLYWCIEGEGCPPLTDPLGLEVAIIYEEGGEWKMWKDIYGSDAYEYTNPESGEEAGNGVLYEHTKVIDFTEIPALAGNILRAIRLTPRYAGFHIRTEPVSCNLGFQGYEINAEGWYGRSRRKVQVARTEPVMPPIFDYSIFSGSEIHPLEKR